MRRIWTRSMLTPALTLSTVLTCGLGALWFIVCFLTAISLLGLGQSSSYRQLVVTADGQALLRTHPAGNRADVEPIYHTLDGKLVADWEDLTFNHSFTWPLPPTADFTRGLPVPSWRNRVVGFSGKTPSSRVFWYLIHDGKVDGSAYFVGFDPESRAQVGFLARDGYHDSLPGQSERFQIPLAMLQGGGWAPLNGAHGIQPNTTPSRNAKLLMYSGGELLRVDFFEQTIEKVATPDRVIALSTFPIPREKDDDLSQIVVRLPEELLIVNKLGEPQTRLPLPVELRDKRLTMRGTWQGEFILEAVNPTDFFAPTTVVWLNPEGKSVRTETVKLRERSQQDPLQAWSVVGLLPVPLLMAALAMVTSVPSWNGGASADFAVNLAERVQQFWLPMTVLMLLSATLAVWTYRRHRRYESHGTAVWAVFVLLLGPLGLAAYLVHRSWPVRRVCEHCGRPTPRNRGACLACAQPFPSPELRGIEVFAS